MELHVSVRRQHVAAMFGMLIRANVDGHLLVGTHQGAMHLLPLHVQVVFPIDVQARMLARHDLLMRQGLPAIRIHEPFSPGQVLRQLGVVAALQQPAERDDVQVAAPGPRLGRCLAARLLHDLSLLNLS